MSVTPEIPPIPKLKYQTMLNLLSKGMHIDKRPLLNYRPIEIIKDVVPNADSSVLVKLGNTQVLAGVKLEIGQPFHDTPNEGVLVVNAEYIPAAAPTFEPGPPDENAIELARVIDRSLREPRVLALDKLTIIPGKKVWILWLDIYVLDHDGNLTDAAMLAAMLALATASLPHYEVDPSSETVKVDKSKKGMQLPINRFVAAVTLYKVGDYILVDPTAEEEALASWSLTLSISEEGHIVGAQKRGVGHLTPREIEQCVEFALAKGRELMDFMKSYVASVTSGKA